MLRIASAAVIVACLGAVALHLGHCGEQRFSYSVPGKGLAPTRVTVLAQPADAHRLSHREIVWRPDPTGESPFGFIPTEWTARPELLPREWEVWTVFASPRPQP